VGIDGVVLIFIILIQKGKGGGLSSAFSGMGASSLLGTKTGDALTWITIGCVGLFLVIGIVLVKFYKPSSPTGLQKTIETNQPMPPAGDGAATPTTDTTGTPVEATSGAAAPAPVTPATGNSPPKPRYLRQRRRRISPSLRPLRATEPTIRFRP